MPQFQQEKAELFYINSQLGENSKNYDKTQLPFYSVTETNSEYREKKSLNCEI